MALSAFVDAFNIGTGAAGTTVVRTGYGFQPKACLYFWSGRTESVNAIGPLNLTPGMGLATSPSERCCLSTFSRHATGTSRTQRKQNTAQVIEALLDPIDFPPVGTANGNADLQSFDTDGQTLVIDDPFSTSLRIHCLALGGTDLLEASIFQFQAPLAATTQDITLGYQPDALILCSLGMTTAPPSAISGASFCYGLATANGQGMVAGWDTNGAGTMSSARYGRTGECLALFGTVSSLPFRASLTSLLATGFRLTWAEVDGTSQPYIFGLALRGGSYTVGSLTTVLNTTTTMVASGFGFQPRGALFLSHVQSASASDTAQVDVFTSLGAMSGATTRGAQAWVAPTGINTSNLGSVVRHDAIYGVPAVGGAYTTINALLDIQSIDSDGFTAIMDDADVAACLVHYLAVGDAGGPPPLSGSSAVTQDGQSATSTGAVALAATAPLAPAADTLASTSTLTLGASGAATQAAQATSGTATLALGAQAALLQAAAQLVSTGGQTTAATAALTQDAQGGAATATLALAAQSLLTPSAQGLASTGRLPLVATLSALQVAQSLSSTTTVVLTSALSQAQASQGLVSTGLAVLRAQVAAVQGSQIPTATSTLAVQGTTTLVQTAQTPSSTGALSLTAQSLLSQDPQAAVSVGTLLLMATASGVQAAQTLLSSAGAGAQGSAALTQAAQSGASLAALPLTGQAGLAQPSQTAASLGSLALQGMSLVVQPDHSLASVAVVVTGGTVERSQESQALSSATVLALQATAGLVPAAQMLSSTATLLAQGAGSATLTQTSQGLSSAGSVPVRATGVVPQDPQTLATSGALACQGAALLTQTSQGLASTSTVLLQGEASALQAGDLLASTTAMGAVGTLSALQANASASSAAAVALKAMSLFTQAADGLAAAGEQPGTGVGIVTQGSQTLYSRGGVTARQAVLTRVVVGDQVLTMREGGYCEHIAWRHAHGGRRRYTYTRRP